MHPSRVELMAFCDAEGASAKGRRVVEHLWKCLKCRDEVQRIRTEKDELSPAAPLCATEDLQPGLATLTSSMAAWRNGQAVVLASDVKRRVRSQIEVYLGSPAISLLEQSGIRPEELLAKSGEILDAFLGPAAAEAARDAVLDGLDCVRTMAGIRR